MIELRLSGGASNADVAQSLGGAMSSVPAPSRILPVVTSAMRASGVVWYSCLYVRASGPESLVRAWVASDTPSPNSAVAIGWGASLNSTEDSVDSQLTAPDDVTFTSPADYDDAPEGGSFDADDFRALWIRYTLNPDSTLVPSDQFTIRVEGAPSLPVNTQAPELGGYAQFGQLLGVTTGVWANSPTAYVYKWQRSADGVAWTDIDGETASVYFLQGTDVGYRIRAVVTATNAGGSSSASSASSAVVIPLAPTNTSAPELGGTATVGQTLTSSTGTWSGSPTYSYQWQRSDDGSTGWANISGATASAYTLASGDQDRYVRCRVTATNAGGSTTVSTAASAQIATASVPPSVKAFGSGTSPGESSTTHTISMPSGIAAGDRIIVLCGADAEGQITWNNSTLGSWTQIWNVMHDYTICLGAWWKVASGVEGGQSMTITTALPAPIAYQVYVVSGAAAIEGLHAVSSGATTSIDPPNLAPSWGATGQTLWIAGGLHDDDTVSVTSTPAGYANQNYTKRAGGLIGLVSARKSASSASDNPAAFSINDFRRNIGFTIAAQQA